VVVCVRVGEFTSGISNTYATRRTQWRRTLLQPEAACTWRTSPVQIDADTDLLVALRPVKVHSVALTTPYRLITHTIPRHSDTNCSYIKFFGFFSDITFPLAEKDPQINDTTIYTANSYVFVVNDMHRLSLCVLFFVWIIVGEWQTEFAYKCASWNLYSCLLLVS
jgi:hypothetical protein